MNIYIVFYLNILYIKYSSVFSYFKSNIYFFKNKTYQNFNNNHTLFLIKKSQIKI